MGAGRYPATVLGVIAVPSTLRSQLAALRGVAAGDLPPALLDIRVQQVGDAPRACGRATGSSCATKRAAPDGPVPYWAMPWPSGRVLAETVAADAAGARRRACSSSAAGSALPSIAAARAGAQVLATDGATDAVAFAAHSFALNEVEAEVALVDWAAHGEALAERGPWDLVLAADVFYLQANVQLALRAAAAAARAGRRGVARRPAPRRNARLPRRRALDVQARDHAARRRRGPPADMTIVMPNSGRATLVGNPRRFLAFPA